MPGKGDFVHQTPNSRRFFSSGWATSVGRVFKGCAGGGSRSCGVVRQVGWREWARLPELGVRRLKVKFDTGARACALHAHRFEVIETRRGEFVRFKLKAASKWRKRRCIGYRIIKDTGGKVTERPAILTPIEVGGERFEMEVCLTDRSNMRHRLIIGRQEIRGRFLVDASRAFIHPIASLAAPPSNDSAEQKNPSEL